MRRRVFYDADVPSAALEGERVAVLGYGIQGRAQAWNLRDSGVPVLVGNREDEYRQRAVEEGFEVLDVAEAVQRATTSILLLPDEVQPEVFPRQVAPGLAAGDGLVFAHGFALRYELVEPPPEVDVLLLAPRMPGQYLRQRYLDGWGVPAFISVERDATGRGLTRLLGLAQALGVTRCAAIEVSAAMETELDHFSEHFTYPVIFRTLEVAFEALTAAGYPPEIALMELHGSGEIGQVLLAAAQEGLFEMLDSHASPACLAGIAHHWEDSPPPEPELRQRTEQILERIRDGSFARHLMEQKTREYPERKKWRRNRSAALARAEKNLHKMLHGPGGD
ncbi:MAG: NAD(P)-binding domain-containing protein [Acidobacteriota bacterium]